MRRLSLLLIAAVASVGLGHGASAAPLDNWTGAYVGIAGGVVWGNSEQTDPGVPCNFFGTCQIPAPDDGSYAVTGGIIGVTLGYNWQQGPWVFGVEGDYSWADASGDSQTCGA